MSNIEIYCKKGEISINEIKKEAKRIYEILYDLYKNKVEVNKPLLDLIYNYIDNKYEKYQYLVSLYLVKLIPLGLNVCPNNKYVFVKNNELNTILNKKI